MEPLADWFWSMWGYFVLGGAMLIIGGTLLYGSRKSEGSQRTALMWTSIPLLGCGAFVFLTPFVSITAVLLVLFGLEAYCSDSPAC